MGVPAEQASNINEKIIKGLARGFMRKAGMCRCEECLKAVCARALDALADYYAAAGEDGTGSGAMRSATEEKIAAMKAVSGAAELVKNDPPHDRNGP